MQNVWGETEILQNVSFEDIAPCRSTQIIVVHIVRTADWFCILIRHFFFSLFVCKLEIYNIRIVVSHQVQAMFVCSLQQIIISIYKLYILTRSHLKSSVSGHG